MDSRILYNKNNSINKCKKLNLSDLEVESFVTNITNEQSLTIQGELGGRVPYNQAHLGAASAIGGGDAACRVRRHTNPCSAICPW